MYCVISQNLAGLTSNVERDVARDRWHRWCDVEPQLASIGGSVMVPRQAAQLQMVEIAVMHSIFFA